MTLETLSIIISFGVGCAGLAWFISAQFSGVRGLIYKIISLHNKEDDDRFQELSDSVWNIHVRNAQRDGDSPPARKSMPRRRYLQEEMEGS